MLRLGELTLKSDRSRRRFLRQLIHNIKDALDTHNYEYKIRNLWSRIIIEIKDKEDENVIDILRHVFGIHSLAIIRVAQFTGLDDIVYNGVELFRDKVKGKKFAIRARRAGKHSFRSIDIAKKLGAELKPFSSGVDLSNPDIEIYVEVRGGEVYYYTEIIDSYGGLPIGSEGRAVALVSGGFDSAVAAWYALRRGAEVHYVFCNLDGEAYKNDVIKVLKVLADNWSYGYQPCLYVIDFNGILKEIKNTREDYWNVILKRMMYRVAERIAREINADTIITGESLGQVSSQTMRNLRVSQMAVGIPINRPLFGLDKEDIIKLSREIGTYDYSSKVQEYCAIVPEKPILKASPKKVAEEEDKINLDVLWEAYNRMEVISIREYRYEEESDELGIDYIPDNMKIIDIRKKDEYDEWHVPGAVYASMSEILAEPEKFLKKEEEVLFYCDVGVTSRAVAEYLRSMGYKAYYFKYGLPKLKKLCEEYKKER
jgi:thiamine biosynthesis protein ThiI